MVQAGDVQIGANQYMVTPGKYRRMSDGVREGVMERINITDFTAGQRRALQLETDRSWDAIGVLPTYDGQGVEPGPFLEPFPDGVIAQGATEGLEAHAVLIGNRVYIGIGRYLYRTVAVSAGSWGNLTIVNDFGSGKEISDITHQANDVIVCLGSTEKIKRVANPSGSPTVTDFNGTVYGRHCEAFGQAVVYSQVSAGGSDLPTISIWTSNGTATRDLDHTITRMALHQAKVAIATKRSLYLLGGKDAGMAGSPAVWQGWSGEPEPFFNQGHITEDDDYQFLISYGGKLYTWLANEVCEWNPNTGSNRQGWRPVGVIGANNWGACVAGGWLIVAIKTRNGLYQLWGFNGAGWWLFEQGTERIWPLPTGGAGQVDAIVFRPSSATADLVRLVYRSSTAHTFRSSAQWISPLLHANQPGALKAWAAAKASFAVPDDHGNTASLDYVDVTLAYSIDGGASWTTISSNSWSAAAGRIFTLGGDLPTPVEAQFIQIRVSWSSVLDWTPVLTGLFIDYQLIESQARRRRWEFDCQVSDTPVRRDGTLDSRTGRMIRADLWAAWSAGSPLTFRDIDYDVTPTAFDVRIVSILEKIDRPSDENLLASNTISLVLVEI